MAAILDAAARLFAERGLEGTSMSAIAAASETSIGSLYQFFPSKETIVTALAESYVTDWREMRQAAIAEVEAGDLRAMMERALDLVLEFSRRNAAVETFLEANPATASAIEALQSEIDDVVRSLQRIAPGAPPAKLRLYAKLATGFVKGALRTIIRIDDPAERAALTAEFKEAMWAYLGPRLSE
ncbi:MAG: TetR/AcrR family transcriptional regulator [Candidatus Baltobacteraceae bacterium]